MIHLALEGSGQLRVSFITGSILLNGKQKLLEEEDETGLLLAPDTRVRFNQFIQGAVIFAASLLLFTACIQFCFFEFRYLLE